MMATKQAELQSWKALPADQPILEHMDAIPYKAAGRRYGACGIRIDGSPEFIDAVLSHLKELIAGENVHTRLELSRSEVHQEFKQCELAAKDAQVCYIRLHVRGREGQILQAYMAGACK